MVRKTDLKVVEEFKNRLMKKLKNLNIILFGSRATGKFSEDSDFDLIVVSDDFRNTDLIKRCGLIYDDWDYSFAADFICYTPEEFNKMKKRVSIVSEALKEGVIVG